jgi:L-serine dehydratase
MALESVQEILEQTERCQLAFWQVVLRDDMDARQVTEAESTARMDTLWQAMLDAHASYEANRRSVSGLVGGDGGKMAAYRAAGGTLCGELLSRVIQEALCMGESNACMKRIVAAPTAGACGVLPAVLLPLYETGEATREQILQGLFAAGGVGEVIAHRASIAGASGGCQAEIGAASAMAAAALVQLRGGSAQQIADASAMALKNLLGLVCDPVAGLVEVPCVKRNVVGAVNAMAAADMALAGIRSAIPADEVFDAMGEVGTLMPSQFKETAQGGLAATPTGQAVAARLRQEKS